MYKIIKDNKVIDIIQNPKFIRFLPKTGHIASSDRLSAQGIVGSDNKTLYSFKPVNKVDTIVAEIKKITLEEFNRLQDLLNSGQEPYADESILTKAKRDRIEYLSKICKTKIINGFSVRLSDKNLYNFRLTPEDQLNLLSLENQLNAGALTFIYHATDNPCRLFSRDDMIKIIQAYKKHILFHTTYFNTAKQYINTSMSIDKITLFNYGDDVTSIVKDFTIKQILKNGGNF